VEVVPTRSLSGILTIVPLLALRMASLVPEVFREKGLPIHVCVELAAAVRTGVVANITGTVLDVPVQPLAELNTTE
jgi:Ethanolamine utilization protein EutJ (predicted chaperonin)